MVFISKKIVFILSCLFLSIQIFSANPGTDQCFTIEEFDQAFINNDWIYNSENSYNKKITADLSSFYSLLDWNRDGKADSIRVYESTSSLKLLVFIGLACEKQNTFIMMNQNSKILDSSFIDLSSDETLADVSLFFRSSLSDGVIDTLVVNTWRDVFPMESERMTLVGFSYDANLKTLKVSEFTDALNSFSSGCGSESDQVTYDFLNKEKMILKITRNSSQRESCTPQVQRDYSALCSVESAQVTLTDYEGLKYYKRKINDKAFSCSSIQQ